MKRHHPSPPDAARTALVAVMLMIGGLLLAFVSASPARAATTVDGFVAQWNGKSADFDGAYGAQCVDLIGYYNRDVVGAPGFRGHAYQLHAAAPASHYEKLPANAGPRKGDVAVWSVSAPGSGGFGHAGIVLADRGGSIQVFDQNPGVAQVTVKSKAHLTGYLRPRNLPGNAPSAPAGKNPVGHIDEVSSPANGQVRVRGWAFDPDNSGASIDVHAYVGGPAGHAGADGYPLRANGSRPDVNNVHRISGNHGFGNVLNVGKTGATQVCLYAINIGGGGNVHLGCRTVNVGNPAPRGVLDEVTAHPGGVVKVRGWAFDSDSTGSSLKVHIYLGAQPGQSGARGIEISANKSRPDVNKAFGIGGNHGFDNLVTGKSGGSQRVCAYAINIGNGNHNPQIGCKTVTFK